MTNFLLIRHGLTDAVGYRITGRLPGVHLNETGRLQAAALPDRLKQWKIDAVYSSPLERTLETAGPLAQRLGLPVQSDIAFAEFDFGEWSGMLIEELDKRHDWKMFHTFRSGTRAPGGELLTEVQTRFVDALLRLEAKHRGGTVAIFSHADAIKAALLHYFAAPVDSLPRLQIEPASISILRLEEWGPLILGVNWLE
ncbi:MAG: histidine phosphatase family protein [Acidobacteriaceae bacterium]|nr:histidine phosphatase family protein [Acidobacteriaceae bacterium]